MTPSDNAFISIRLRFRPDARIGPGKIAILEAIQRTGSIAAAGREMGMSYRRAWLLIDALNATFDEPVVLASPGGSHGGGATLTETGHELVRAYRSMEADAIRSARRHFARLEPRIRAEIDPARTVAEPPPAR